MKKTASLIELKESIILLELQQVYEKQLLKDQFKTTYQKLRPANLIKDTFKELVKVPDFKGNLLDTVLSIATGYISKKVIIGGTHNPIKQLLGTVLQMEVTGIVAKNSDSIKSTAVNLMQHFLKRKNASA